MPKCPPHIYVCIKNRCFSAKTCLNASPGQSVPGAHGAAHHGNVLSQAVHLQCSPGQAAVLTIRNAGPTVKERCLAPVSGSLFLALPAKRHSCTLCRIAAAPPSTSLPFSIRCWRTKPGIPLVALGQVGKIQRAQEQNRALVKQCLLESPETSCLRETAQDCS